MTSLVTILKGILIGTGAILPGISGGVLCVVLGVYQPLMSFLAHPFAALKKGLSLLIPLLAGMAIGVLLFSKIIDFVFTTWETQAIWLFAGLVMGTLPSMYGEAGSRGRPKSAWISLAAGVLVMGTWLFFVVRGETFTASPSLIWWMICGVLWGLGFIIPGLSPSSLFIFFGIYQPMTAAIGNLDFSVIIPMGLALVATVLLLAKLMTALLNKYFPQVMHVIIGIVLVSTVAMLPFGAMSGFGTILGCIVCFAVGCVIAYWMEKMAKKLTPSEG